MNTTTGDSTVTQSSREIQQQVVDAAIARFLDRGFPDTTMQDIVAKSGLPADVVSGEFPSKYDVLRSLGDLNKAAATGMLKGVLDKETLPSVPEILGSVGEFFEALSVDGGPAGVAPQAMGIALYDPEVNLIMDDVFEALHSGWVDVATRMAAEGRLPRDANPRDVGTALFALVIGFMFQNLLGGVKAAELRGGLAALLG